MPAESVQDSSPPLNPFGIRAILSRALLFGLLVACAFYAVILYKSWWSVREVPDHRKLRNYWDADNALTSFVVTPSHVIVGSKMRGVLDFDREIGLWKEYNNKATKDRLPSDHILEVSLDNRRDQVFYRTLKGGLASSKLNLQGWETLYPITTCPVGPEGINAVTMLGKDWLIMGTDNGLSHYHQGAKDWSWSSDMSERETTNYIKWISHLVKGLRSSNMDENRPEARRVNDLLYLKGSGQDHLLAATTSGIEFFLADPADRVRPLAFLQRIFPDTSIEIIDPTSLAGVDSPIACRTSKGGVILGALGQVWQQIIGDRGFRSYEKPQISIVRLDSANELLIVGTKGQSWDVYDNKRRDWLNPSVKSHTKVNDIVAFDGLWWIATNKGLALFEPKERKVFKLDHMPSHLADSEITRLAVLDQTLFILTASGGLTAFQSQPKSEWNQLIPHQGCMVRGGSIVSVLVFRGELWLGFSNADILVYNKARHELRHEENGLNLEREGSYVLTRMIRSTNRIWCVITDTLNSSNTLFYLEGYKWHKAPGRGHEINDILILGDGLLARTSSNALLYYHDNMAPPTELYSGRGPEAIGARSVPMAACRNREMIFLSPQSRGRSTILYAYNLLRHTWSNIHLPVHSPVKELHSRDNCVYVVTEQGGLGRIDPSSGNSWNTLIAETELNPEDKANPEIIDIALWADAIYVVFGSGNIYQYYDKSSSWTLEPSFPARIRQLEAIQNALFVGIRDGTLLTYSNPQSPPLHLLHGGLGRRPKRLLLAIDDSINRLWLLTANGLMGAYNLETHNWDLIEQFDGDKELRLKRWGLVRRFGEHELLWVVTNHNAAIFASSESEATLLKSFPHGEIFDVICSDGQIYLLANLGFDQYSSTKKIYQIDGKGNIRDLSQGMEQPWAPLAIKGVDGGILLFTDDNQILVYSNEQSGWRRVAKPMRDLQMPTLEFWYESILRARVTGIVMIFFLVVLFYLNWFWKRDAWPRLRRRARRLFWGGILICAGYLFYPVWQVNLSFPTPYKESPKKITGEKGFLNWQTTKDGAVVAVRGRNGEESVFDENGRFLFDHVLCIVGEGRRIKLYTPIGVWSCQVPQKEGPRHFGELSPEFEVTSEAPDITGLPERTIFREGVWEWREYPGKNLVRVVRIQGKRTVQRDFYQGRWADTHIKSMLAPDDAAYPIFLKTQAGIVEAGKGNSTNIDIVKESMTTEWFREKWDMGKLREMTCFNPNRAQRREIWQEAVQSGNIIFQDHYRLLKWEYTGQNVRVKLNNTEVSMIGDRNGSLLAFDHIEDIAIDSQAESPAFWVRSPLGDHKYTISQKGKIKLTSSIKRGTSGAFSRSLTPQPVHYAGTVWLRQGTEMFGKYDGMGSREGVIRDGRFLHDVILDLSAKHGYLRLATEVGFVDYRYDSSLAMINKEYSRRATRDCFVRPGAFVWDGTSWRKPSDTVRMPSSVLSMALDDGTTKAIDLLDMNGSGYKFVFDVAKGLRLRGRKVLLNTPCGIFELSVDTGKTDSVPSLKGKFKERSDMAALFDKEKSEWRPVERKAEAVLYQTRGEQGEWQRVEFVEGKFPWDYVDLVVINEEGPQIHTRAGIVVPGMKRLIKKPEPYVLSRTDRSVNASSGEFINLLAGVKLDPAWGEPLNFFKENEMTWILCRKRVVHVR